MYYITDELFAVHSLYLVSKPSWCNRYWQFTALCRIHDILAVERSGKNSTRKERCRQKIMWSTYLNTKGSGWGWGKCIHDDESKYLCRGKTHEMRVQYTSPTCAVYRWNDADLPLRGSKDGVHWAVRLWFRQCYFNIVIAVVIFIELITYVFDLIDWCLNDQSTP